MEFVLFYSGPLKSNAGPSEKNAIRTVFHPQIRALWGEKPLNQIDQSRIPPVKVLTIAFTPLVRQDLDLMASIDVTMLRPEPIGNIVTQGGDIDNRIKTLLDALRIPKNENEMKGLSYPGEDPSFHCLLEDDSLITHLSVSTEQYLEPSFDKSHVIMLIRVRITQLRSLWQIEERLDSAGRWQDYEGK